MTGVHAARTVADRAIERFIAAADRERLVLYRMHLQANVRSASPLTLDLAEHFGVDIGSRLDTVRPPAEWPWRSRTATLAKSLAHSSLAAYQYLDPKRRAVHGMLRRHAVVPGFVHFGDEDNLLAFHFDGPWLSMEGCIGPCHVRIVKGMAALTLPAGIPDTLAVAMVGRPIDALVENPALAGRGYSVRRVREARTGTGPTLVFATGSKRFAMPWPELLGASGNTSGRGGMARAGGAAHAAGSGLRRARVPGVSP